MINSKKIFDCPENIGKIISYKKEDRYGKNINEFG